MTDIKKFVPAKTVASQFDRANARRTAAEGTTLGSWWLHAANVNEWIAESDSQSESGRIIFNAAGWSRVVLDDMPDWRPFASLSGPPQGRKLQMTARYGWNGAPVESSTPLAFDSTLGRYVAIGSTSDGTLSGNGMRAVILIGTTDQQDWQLNDLVFGWVQLGDES